MVGIEMEDNDDGGVEPFGKRIEQRLQSRNAASRGADPNDGWTPDRHPGPNNPRNVLFHLAHLSPVFFGPGIPQKTNTQSNLVKSCLIPVFDEFSGWPPPEAPQLYRGSGGGGSIN